ncbi:MAG: 50S ribosomal protein L31 [Candidatus Lloydbacteria bacterium RIFCSPHIGHO2_01_FULL_41_20]|uniref:Large ribosomal subunit protein bL31 n=1 Tax=Candidatus Lloydbacteria bacterium RIFCSPHIGHO2_01_FULL_41_20 TaxID=1798657 RepID=A0A1G2CT74_9BACT|nr:MAG: 50S ribosomal protein L31 [Candidatus Lloydbacteria bacterium RIFCSPHIGHO2_01_FULL_41_20]
MKAEIHPKYFSDAKAVCACGATYTVGSTKNEIHMEICSACHPFYTGNDKIIDTAGRVERFKKRRDVGVTKAETTKFKKATKTSKKK